MNYLAQIQGKLKAPKSQRNTFGNYNYRSCEDILEALKPLIAPDGYYISLSDEVVLVGNRIYVKATATLTNGEQVFTSTAFAREEETKKGMDGSQITGAASSYARKYALNGLFAIDDAKDSDATNTHEKEQQQPQQQPERWMTEKEYNSYLKRILDGEAGIVENCKKHYKMKKEYLAGLEQAVKDTPTYVKEGK